jgi:hypothetical protein
VEEVVEGRNVWNGCRIRGRASRGVFRCRGGTRRVWERACEVGKRGMGNSGERSGECAVYPEMIESGGHASRVRVALPTERSESSYPTQLYHRDGKFRSHSPFLNAAAVRFLSICEAHRSVISGFWIVGLHYCTAGE